MISRRTFIFGAGAAGLLGLAGYGYRTRDDIEVERLNLPLPGWTGPHLNLVFLSDLHRGPYVPEAYMVGVAAAVAALRPGQRVGVALSAVPALAVAAGS